MRVDGTWFFLFNFVMTSSPSVSWQRNWLFILFLFATTFVVYYPAWHGGFLWKDDMYILHDPGIHFFQGLYQIWFKPTLQYYPLTFTTFWVEYHLWGLDPLGYHLVNIFLHALNAVLLWHLLRRLSVPGAWLAAAIFALHPVNVESVAWIVERKNTLSGVFYLCSIMAALKFWLPELDAPSGSTGSTPAPLTNWKYYWLAFALFVCAIFSKTTTIPLPAVVLLLVWWKRGKITWRDISPFFLFLAAGVAMGLITHHVEHNLGAGKDFQYTVADRFIVASWNFWFYLNKLVWPHPLMFVYPRWTIHPANPLAWLPLLAIVPVAIILWLNRNGWGRSAFVALAYFAGLMFLMLGFFNIFFFLYSFVSDHFVYLACMGPLALIAAGVALVFNRRGRAPGSVSTGQIVFSAGLLALLGMFTWNQCRAYTDAVTLWRDTIAQNPSAFLARNNLGDILLQQGQLDAAIEQYQKSVDVHPDALIYHNLGNALLSRRDAPGAFSAFQKEVQLQPDSFSGYADLGNFYLQIGRSADAIQYLQKSFDMKSDVPMVCYNLGNAYMQGRQTDQAIRYWQKAVDLEPDFAMAHNNLANAFSYEGQYSQAIQHWQQALTLHPNLVSAQVNLAWVLATCPLPALRNGADALALAQEADQMTGGANPMILRALAAAYAENGQFPAAVAAAQQAVQLANQQRNAGLAANIQTQLKFYQSGKPFRETATATH